MKAQPYIPYEKKLDLKTVSCLFVDKYFRFYYPSTKNIIETDNVKFIKDIQNSESQLYKNFTSEEEQIIIP